MLQTVYFEGQRPFPIEVLIPMRLVVYNQGSRRLLITTDSLDLPAPIVVWLCESPMYRGLVARVDAVQPRSEGPALIITESATEPAASVDNLHGANIYHL